MNMKYDFSGWATRNDLKCSDGRVIRKDAFAHNDGQIVPLVWNHQHNDADNVLGHALLENREDGVYTYCSFNDSSAGQKAKELVKHGDIKSLSIYANHLRQNGADVIHGAIREVSLVLAGANPGAFIDSVMIHGERNEEDGVIYTDFDIELAHSDKEDEAEVKEDEAEVKEDEAEVKEDEMEHANDEESEDDSEEGVSLQEVFDGMTDIQKECVYRLVELTKNNKDEVEHSEEEANMANVFENNVDNNTLSHADVEGIFNDAKRFGSLKEAVLAHTASTGITNISNLFPEVQAVNGEPDFLGRDQAWVSAVMDKAHKTPFARIKSWYADITGDNARARGYVKGNEKVNEIIEALKRETTPTTIYKKQKLDRDDILDITDFNVVNWLKGEMQVMLKEEIARAIIVGDGRDSSSNDKISSNNIRPIWQDNSAFTVNTSIEVASGVTEAQKAKAFIQNVVRNRKYYKGSGNITCFMTEDMLTACLLMEDTNQRVIYESVDKLATALRVKEIVTVPVMDNCTRTDSNSITHTLAAVLVDMADYNIGTNAGGQVTMFDDFDINYNQQIYLMETRCSGALVKPKSAMTFEFHTAAAAQG